MKISQALRKLLENPDDLSELPGLIAKVEEMEKQEEVYQERINKLQEINRSYLAQIPIPGEEQEDKKEDKQPTLEDAKQHIINTLTGGNE